MGFRNGKFYSLKTDKCMACYSGDGEGNIMVDGHWAKVVTSTPGRKMNNYPIY